MLSGTKEINPQTFVTHQGKNAGVVSGQAGEGMGCTGVGEEGRGVDQYAGDVSRWVGGEGAK